MLALATGPRRCVLGLLPRLTRFAAEVVEKVVVDMRQRNGRYPRVRKKKRCRGLPFAGPNMPCM